MDFYTNFCLHRGFIHVRGVRGSFRYKEKIKLRPYMYCESKRENAEYRTLDGRKADKVHFENRWEAAEWIKGYEKIHGFNIYGLTNHEYVWVNDEYPGTIDFDLSKIRIANLDIETAFDQGFPSPELANQEVTAITVKCGPLFHIFGTKDYVRKANEIYYKCVDEHAMLSKFLIVWQKLEPDVVTGWHIRFFDIPYLVNRLNRLNIDPNMLSPWNVLDKGSIEEQSGRERQYYDILGISTLDYLELYQKFKPNKQESYKLDHIAYVELGERKLDYSEHANLMELFKKDFQKFIEYNVKDVALVDRLEDALGYMELVFTMAYDAKVQYVDTLATVKPWDSIIHNYLIERNIVVPIYTKGGKDGQYEGAFVKEPVPAVYDWVVSYDLESLYPKTIEQYNLSPETFRGKLSKDVEDFLSRDFDTGEVKKKNWTIAANGSMHTREFQGFLPALMEKMFDDRAAYKKKMLTAKKEYERTKDETHKAAAKKFNNFQLAKKIQLNSAYGMLGNQYSRWFDINYAESITKSARLSTLWIINYINRKINEVSGTEGVDYVIASDTDSCYIHFAAYLKTLPAMPTKESVDEVNRFCEEVLTPYIEQGYNDLAEYMNVRVNKMRMKREKISDRGLWTAKKRYALNVWDSEGVRYSEPSIEVTGIEVVRSSTPEFCRKHLKECINIVLTKNEQTLWDYVADVRTNFYAAPFEVIATPMGVNGLDKNTDPKFIYKKGAPMQARACLLYNNMIKTRKLTDQYPLIYDSEKIKFCILKMPNPLKENVIASPGVLPRELGLDQYLDYDAQFDKVFGKPLQKILDLAGWHMEEQSTLDKFY